MEWCWETRPHRWCRNSGCFCSQEEWKKIDESLNNCLITFHEPCAAPFFPDFHFYFIFSSVIFLTESFIISAVAAVVGLREAVAGKWKEDEIIFICELVGWKSFCMSANAASWKRSVSCEAFRRWISILLSNWRHFGECTWEIFVLNFNEIRS